MDVLTSTPIAIKEILMATDYSPASEAALPYALQLARRFNAGLHVVHVLLPGEWEPTADDTSAAFECQPVEQAERHMASFLSSRDLGGARCDYLIRRGDKVWEELYKIIQDKDINLVVLGTHGRGGLGKLLVGSVAEEVFRQAPCPVLTIGPRVASAAPRSFRKIAFATDLTPESLEHLPFVLDFADEYQAQLVIIHVPGDEYLRSGNVIETIETQMRQLIPPRAKCEYVVDFGDPAYVIRTVAEERDCDLIMMGAHAAGGGSTHFAGAIAHRILLEAQCPVLTVHWPNQD
jgi:nucleotide-binding universal stress UspA family protein